MSRIMLAAATAVLAMVLVGGMASAAPGVSGMAHIRAGLASWYGPRFEGRLMSNGCRFRAARVSAASRTLPIGSWVKVKRGRRSVVVEITDRGPYVGARVLDLSRAAAERLDMVAAGVVMVSIEPLSARLPVGCAVALLARLTERMKVRQWWRASVIRRAGHYAEPDTEDADNDSTGNCCRPPHGSVSSF